MKKVILAILLTACGTENNPLYEGESESAKEVWICNNPGSIEHHQLCSDKCYEHGNNHTYCWLLTEDDCVDDVKYAWQHETCGYLTND